MTIITFGQITELSATQINIDAVVDTAMLKQRLGELYPVLLDKKYAIAIDKMIISENTIINEGSIIALLPPFSGG